ALCFDSRATLPDLHSFPTRRSSDLSRSLPATALALVIAASTACSGKRPTFGKPLVHDAGGSSDDMADAAASEESTYDGSDSSNRSEEHTSELQSRENLVCRLLLEKK